MNMNMKTGQPKLMSRGNLAGPMSWAAEGRVKWEGSAAENAKFIHEPYFWHISAVGERKI